MTIKSDKWIKEMSKTHRMIVPFEPNQIRTNKEKKLISYGTSSYGYDVRCSNEFKVFTNINSATVDPKNFDETSLDKFQYTLMPTHMRQFFSEEELRTVKMHKPFSFTKDIPVMQINRIQRKTDEGFKGLEDTDSALYDTIIDPGQLNPMQDQALITKYKELMINVIKENDPPKELLSNYFNI